MIPGDLLDLSIDLPKRDPLRLRFFGSDYLLSYLVALLNDLSFKQLVN